MNFFKVFFASLLAMIVGLWLVASLWVLTIVGIVAFASMQSAETVDKASVLRLDLGTITDAPAESVFETFDFEHFTSIERTTLLSAIETIEAAAKDPLIKGIYLNLNERANVSTSSLEEIRAALAAFRQTGKFIVAYQDFYSQTAYWFASVADKVYLNPAGDVEWKGLSMQTMFYRGLLEKLGVEPVIIRHGSFKSAVEPFMLDKMSDENRLQNQILASSIWRAMVTDVAGSRKIAINDLQSMASELTIDSPEKAVELGLVDELLYEDQVKDRLAQRLNEETADELNVVSFAGYNALKAMERENTPSKKLSPNKVAIIYAQGDIVSGSGGEGQLGNVALTKKLANIRKDSDVKALVIRVNSPGGSALASDVMLREIKLLQEKMPVVVSMGSVAASGGYYISCAADAILADRTTVTGSIGVFGLYMNIGGALADKLGISVDGVTTNTYSDIGSPYRAPSDAEMAFYQRSIETVYSQFVGHVAEGRRMPRGAVDAVGGGRIWAGGDALEKGLVDGLGGLKEAIDMAAGRAGVADNFRVWEVPASEEGVMAMLGGLSARVRTNALRDELGEAFAHYNSVRAILSTEGVQARMPWVFEIK